MSSQIFDMTTEREVGLAAAHAVIKAGGVIVLPTDTVYGVGADAFDARAVASLLEAKQRGRDMPPPVLISDTAVIDALARDIPRGATALAARFWPGALTLIMNAQPSLAMDLGETNGTIAVRVPAHDLTRDLLRRTGPLAVSSANVSGRPAATTAAEAETMLRGAVAVYLDAGPTPGNIPSTIVDFASSDDGVVRRLGAISLEQLREVWADVAAVDAG